MKKLSLFLIAILISFCSLSQKQDTVKLPESVLSKIIDELLVKDHLQFTVNIMDSTLTVFKHTIGIQQQEIAKFKLNEEDYKLVITNLQKEKNIDQQQIKELKKKNFKAKIISFFKGMIVGVAGLIIYIVVHK